MQMLPFFAVNRSIASAVRSWATPGVYRLVTHNTESLFAKQLNYLQLPVVAFGVDEKLLARGLISRTSVGEHRPLIISVTETADEHLMVGCFEQGADRVVALSQCSEAIFQALLSSLRPGVQIYPPYRLYETTYTIHLGEHAVRLRKHSYDFTAYLFANNGRFIPTPQLLKDIWGINPKHHTPDRVKTRVSEARRKLKLDGTHGWELRNSRSRGYGIFRTILA